MIIDLINRISILLFILSCLTTLRHGYYFIQSYFTSNDEVPVKYKISKISLLFLGVSISYILTIIFTGIKLI